MLQKNQKIVFVLTKIEGLSYAEAGEVMRLTPSAVDSLLHRAKNNLKKYLLHHFKNTTVLN